MKLTTQLGYSTTEVIAVAVISLLIAAAFFTYLGGTIENAFEKVDQYQQKVLLDAAQRFLLVHGFWPNLDDQVMIIYLWSKDGSPSFEEYEGYVQEINWPKLRRTSYLGVRVEQIENRVSSASPSYLFTLLPKED